MKSKFDNNLLIRQMQELSDENPEMAKILGGIVAQESGGNPDAVGYDVTGTRPSYGRTQMEEPTFYEVAKKLGWDGMSIEDFKKNPLAQDVGGLFYANDMAKKFGGNAQGIAAYNLGQGKVRKILNAQPDANTNVAAFLKAMPPMVNSHVNKVYTKAGVPLDGNAVAAANDNRVENAKDYNDILNSHNAAVMDTDKWKAANPDTPERVVNQDSLELNRKMEEVAKKQRVLDAWRQANRKDGGDLGANELGHYAKEGSDLNAQMSDLINNPNAHTTSGQNANEISKMQAAMDEMIARGDHDSPNSAIGTLRQNIEKQKQLQSNYSGISDPTFEQKQLIGLDRLDKNYNSVTDSYRDQKGNTVNKLIPKDSFFNSATDEAEQMSPVKNALLQNPNELDELEQPSQLMGSEGLLRGPSVSEAPPEDSEASKLQRMLDNYRMLQKGQMQNTTNARYLQAANLVGQAFAAGQGAKIGDGSEFAEGLIKDAGMPTQNAANEQLMRQSLIKNQQLEDDENPNSDAAKFQMDLVKNLANSQGISTDKLGNLSSNDTQKIIPVLAELQRAREAAESRKALAAEKNDLKKEEKAKLVPKQLEDIASYDKVINAVDNIMADKPNFDTGRLSYGMNKVASWVGLDDAKKSAFKSSLVDQLAGYIKSISGVAVSDNERKFLSQAIPSVNDNDEQFMEKARAFKTRVQNLKKVELDVLKRGGKDISGFEDKAASPAEQAAPPPQIINSEGLKVMKKGNNLVYVDSSGKVVRPLTQAEIDGK